jgi:hypothetical protein
VVSCGTWAEVERRAATRDYTWPIAGDRFPTVEVIYDRSDLSVGLRRLSAEAAHRADCWARAWESLADLYEHVHTIFLPEEGDRLFAGVQAALRETFGAWAQATASI